MSSDFMGVLVAALLVMLPLVWVVAMFNSLVRRRNSCDESWAGIDTELKRRYDLIPNLVQTVKAYARHEQEVLERVVQARQTAITSTGSPKSQAVDENELVGGLNHLLAIAEGYPELKANRNFLELQAELANTEDRIARARRFYNANVRDFNNRVEMFPSNLVAKGFGFQGREYFEVDELQVRRAPAVAFDH